jgi:hypothetical protein
MTSWYHGTSDVPTHCPRPSPYPSWVVRYLRPIFHLEGFPQGKISREALHGRVKEGRGMCMSKDSFRKSKLNEANLLMDDCRSFSSVTNRFSGCIRGSVVGNCRPV